MIVNIDLMVKYVTQNKHRIMITVDVNIKSIEATYMWRRLCMESKYNN